MRIACLLAPNLPVAAVLRAHPELTGQPLAVVSEPGPRAFVLDASSEASEAGVAPGVSLAHAQALCPRLRSRVRSPSLERAARAALLDVAFSASPRAELAPPLPGPEGREAAVFLDASGVERLFRSEAGLATALVARARALGLPTVASVAASRAVAQALARALARSEGAGAVQVLPPGRETAFLSSLPLAHLALSEALAEDLARFGLRRVGELLRLPRSRVSERLGPEAEALVARLRGERAEPPLPEPGSRRLEEGTELESPLAHLEPLLFVLRRLLSRLLARLATRGLACGELELRLELAGRKRECRRLGLAAPTLDPRTLLRRLRLALEHEPPRCEVEGLVLITEGAPLRREQLDLFRPAGPAPATLDALLAELEALCGVGRVGRPVVPDDPRPQAWALGTFAPPPLREGNEDEAWRRERACAPAGSEAGFDPSARPQPAAVGLALRALRPPVPARVRLRAGRPSWVESALARGEVVRCAGPWRTCGGWWTPATRYAFDHFDVQTSDGLLVRLRLDRLHGSWCIDALYD